MHGRIRLEKIWRLARCRKTAIWVHIVLQELIKLALKAKDISYVPYSQFHVGGALVRMAEIYTGCNVENSSYGATILSRTVGNCKGCVSRAKKNQEIAVVSDSDTIQYPVQYVFRS